jgi:hypothetical protein
MDGVRKRSDHIAAFNNFAKGTQAAYRQPQGPEADGSFQPPGVAGSEALAREMPSPLNPFEVTSQLVLRCRHAFLQAVGADRSHYGVERNLTQSLRSARDPQPRFG